MTQIKQSTKRIFAWVLTIALVFTMMPGYALADEGDGMVAGAGIFDGTEYSVTSGSALYVELTATSTITDFVFLDAIQVEIGTHESDIPFPTEVIANVQTDGDDYQTSTVTVGVGEWQLAFGEYNPDAENRYVFEAVRESLVLPDGVTLPEDVELPCVAVDIGEVEIGIVPLDGSSVSYLDENGDEQTANNVETLNSDSGAVVITGDVWYLATGSGTLSGNYTISANADVKLILADGCDYTFSNGIRVANSAKLTIYAQSTGDNMGKLTATGGSPNGAGIGGYLATAPGLITINGGNITATGASGAAGIGGGGGAGAGSITINGGNITANGAGNGSGIGRGKDEGGTITINGGTIIATGTGTGLGIGGDTTTIDYTSKTGASVTAKGAKAFSATPTQTSVQSHKIGSDGTQTDGAYTYDSSHTEVTLYSDAVGGGGSGDDSDALALKAALEDFKVGGDLNITISGKTVTFSGGTATFSFESEKVSFPLE